MSKITIGKKEYNVEEELLNQCELLFYEENPRVYSILRSNGTIPTQKEIEAKMKEIVTLTNKKLPSFKHMTETEVRFTEFEKTSSRKIKRFKVK